jgi:pimeloyl-ACP methyl ester carboxylesterase
VSAATRVLKTAAVAAGAAAAAAATVKVAAARQRRHHDPYKEAAFKAPFEREHELATFDGGTMYVIESGPVDGQPIVLCHGVTLSVRTWVNQLAELPTRGFRVFAFDSRGHGGSVCGTAGHDVEHIGTDVRTLVEHFDLHDAVIVGHSMGGIATQVFATSYPDVLHAHVAGLVLLSTLARAPFSRFQNFVRVARESQPIGGRVFDGVMARRDIGYLLTRISLGRKAPESLVEFTREMVMECSGETRFLAPLALAGFDITPKIGAIDIPTLIICGTADLLTPPAESRRIARRIKTARAEWVQGGGHMLMLERPELVDDLIASFAADVRAPALSA